MSAPIEDRLRVLDLRMPAVAPDEHVDEERLAAIVSGEAPTGGEAAHLCGCDACVELLVALGEGLEALGAVGLDAWASTTGEVGRSGGGTVDAEAARLRVGEASTRPGSAALQAPSEAGRGALWARPRGARAGRLVTLSLVAVSLVALAAGGVYWLGPRAEREVPPRPSPAGSPPTHRGAASPREGIPESGAPGSAAPTDARPATPTEAARSPVLGSAQGAVSVPPVALADPAGGAAERLAHDGPVDPSPRLEVAAQDPVRADDRRIVPRRGAEALPPDARQVADSPAAPAGDAGRRTHARTPELPAAHPPAAGAGLAAPRPELDVLRRDQKPVARAPINGPPLGYGRLRLNAKPSAEVFIDGRSFGFTPLVDVRLPEGPHDVVLKFDSPAAREPEQRFRVLIEADSTWQTTRTNLRE